MVNFKSFDIGAFQHISDRFYEISGRRLNAQHLHVLGKNETLYEADLRANVCTCGHKNCSHVRTMKNVIFKERKDRRFIQVSHFHKELRRGDVDAALLAGAWVGHFREKENIAGKLYSIALEETRSPMLLHILSDKGITWQDKVRAFCGAKKKWEMEVFREGRRILYSNRMAEIRRPLVEAGVGAFLDRVAKYQPKVDVREAMTAWSELLYQAGAASPTQTEQLRTVLDRWYEIAMNHIADQRVRRPLHDYCAGKRSEWNRFEAVLNIAYGGLSYEELVAPTQVACKGIDPQTDYQIPPDYVYDDRLHVGNPSREPHSRSLSRQD